MPITRLKLKHIRNLSETALTFSPGLNFIVGQNGAGKTALFEALSLLAHGRSFRTHRTKRIISTEADECFAYASLESGEDMGVSKRLVGDGVYKLSGKQAASVSVMADALPLQIVNEDAFQLLIGPAKIRRKLFDWLVFHVKHEFKDCWKSYNQCLKQRNSLLRRDKIGGTELHPWDTELARLGNKVHELRLACTERYFELGASIFTSIDRNAGFSINCSYKPGWDTTKCSLLQCLEIGHARDLKLGYTAVGPHRSEFTININGCPAHEVLSRGQQKTLIAAFIIAQLAIYTELVNKRCVLLVDDLAAELDADHIKVFSEWLKHVDAQVFVSGVDEDKLLQNWAGLENINHKVFHVKHGGIKEQESTAE